MAAKLIFIRHGQTAWNAKKIYCGSADIGLNRKGRAQAEKLKKLLRKMQIDKICSSNKKRALQTARILFPGKKIERLSGLREMDFGLLEGLNYQQAMKKYSRVYQQWLKDPFRVTIPGGESLRDFKRRVVRAAGKIRRANKGKTAAIVCHGGTIGIYLCHVLKTRDFWRQIPKSASITVVNNRDGSIF